MCGSWPTPGAAISISMGPYRTLLHENWRSRPCRRQNRGTAAFSRTRCWASSKPIRGVRAAGRRRLLAVAGAFGLGDQRQEAAGRKTQAKCSSQRQPTLEFRGPRQALSAWVTSAATQHLLLNGELPTATQLEYWQCEVMRHTMTHENVKKFMDGFHYDAHPMGILISTVAALSTFYPEAKNIGDPKSRHKQIVRLIGKMPTLAAYAYRHRLGLPFISPDPELGYTKNYMNMLWKRTEPKYAANPVLARALEVLFILHADHEQNCSTSAMRAVGSSHADPFVTTAAAIAALSGPLHGGANEEVL